MTTLIRHSAFGREDKLHYFAYMENYTTVDCLMTLQTLNCQIVEYFKLEFSSSITWITLKAILNSNLNEVLKCS